MKTKTERQAYEKAGRRAETLAVTWLRLKGYLVLERRYKTRQGEIDIIAKKGSIIVMAEVKQRSDATNLHETVSFNNSQRIICLLYTSPSPRDQRGSRMPSSA